MKETLSVIERLHRDGVVGLYAIGGAVGATFHLEPMATLDVDIFILFEHTPLALKGSALRADVASASRVAKKA